MDGTIAWEKATTLGAGYDVETFQIVKSALTDLSTTRDFPEDAVGIQFESHVIRTEEERMSQIETPLGASGSATPFFSLGASSSYLPSIKCSETSMTTITLEKCLKKPLFRDSTTEKFSERYGQYYISGREFQSSLVAVCTHTAETKEQLDKFKVDTKGTYKLANLDALMSWLRKVKSTNIDTNVKIQTSGTKATTASTYTAASDDLRGIVEDFMLNHIPVPQVALLRHYSYLKPKKIPRPHLDSLVPTALNDAYREYLSLELRSEACLLGKISEISLRLAGEKKVLSGLKPSMETFQEDLCRVQQNLASCKDDLDKLFAVQKVLQQTFCGPAEIRHDEWYKAKQITEWPFGCTETSSPALSSQVALKRIKCEGGTYRVAHDKRMIVGLRVESRRRDGHNGAWRLTAGRLGDTELQLQFSSGVFHDRDWAVEIWTVHKDNTVLREGCTW